MKIVPIRTLAVALLVAFGLFEVLPLSATPPPTQPQAKPLEVTYFFLPG